MKKNRSTQEIAIKLTSISKKYTIHHEKPTLIERLVKGKNEEFLALKDINLAIKKGERVGIIGPNGSGKTTLLKIMSGITAPSSGNVYVNGRIVSLIDLEAGFHLDLSGYENIFLSGMILGMSKAEITRKLDKIISFADIRQFIDTSLFTYSEGMKLRLGFSIAIHADPDILILDEALSVGDRNFQIKARKKIQQLFTKNKTIIMVSHWTELIKANCQHIFLLKRGRISKEGDETLIDAYATKKIYP